MWRDTASCISFHSYDVGRDGLTHNMLDLIHQHWKRRRVCKIKCKGVPTVDMDNVCNKLEVFIFSFPSVFCVRKPCEHNCSLARCFICIGF